MLKKEIKTSSEIGFTIVELLIVIVVMAILVAITVVAFNGVQKRAQSATVGANAASWKKLLVAYTAQTGRPLLLAGAACLAESPVAVEGMVQGQCAKYTGAAGPSSPTIGELTSANISELKTVSSNIPSGNIPLVKIDYGGWGTIMQRGIFYSSDSSGGQVLQYWLNGDQACAATFTKTLLGGTATECYSAW